MTGYFDEPTRLTILGEYDTADWNDDLAIDALTNLASDICGAPICLVSLVETDRQHFIGKTGVAAAETPREVSFCQHAMLMDHIMVVPDASSDPRFAGNTLVTGAPFIRFYAGAPLRSGEGAPLGALCVIDRVPRDGLTPLQAKTLRVLADQVMARLEARRKLRLTTQSDQAFENALVERENRFRVLADTMPQMVWSARPDGYHDYYNARWYEFTGASVGSTDGDIWNGMVHADDQEAVRACWRQSIVTGEPYEIEYRLLNAAGEHRWALGRALPIRDAAGVITRWFGTCTDIHEQKLLLEQREIVSQELSHRIKNIFSIIAGMISLSARRYPQAKETASDLRERVTALGRAHNFVRPHATAAVTDGLSSNLHGMLRHIFAPYDIKAGPRIVLEGFDPIIDDRSTTPLALLFHELATNAAKFGALSREGGTVMLAVSRDHDDVTLDWCETGGPAVTEIPEFKGLGTQLIEMSAVRQLAGQLDWDWHQEGLRLGVRVPGASLVR